MKVVINPPAGIKVSPPQNQVVRLGVGGTATNTSAINSSVNAAANTVAVYANGSLVLATADLNFNNTATINVYATPHGTGQVNIAFTANVSNEVSLNVIDAVVANSITVGNVIITNNVALSVADFTSITGTTTANGIPVQIDSFSASVYTCVDYIIQLTTLNALHASKILCMQDGLSTYGTEYATLQSNGSMGTFAISFSGTNINLYYTPINPLNQLINYKLIRSTITN